MLLMRLYVVFKWVLTMIRIDQVCHVHERVCVGLGLGARFAFALMWNVLASRYHDLNHLTLYLFLR